jgi:glycosyltransferase involved in cell wall biosynthesis
MLGFGIFYSELVDSLQRLAVFGGLVETIDLTSREQLHSAVETSSDSDINIWFWLNSSISKTRGIHIVWSLFESDVLAQDYIENHLSLAHVVWVPSAWGKGVLVSHGMPPDRVDVIPGGVNPSLFHPFLRPAARESNSPFRFLTIGKYEKRKGYEPLLSAFKIAFGNSMSVVLDIKADFFINHTERKNELELLVNKMGLRNVNLVWGKLDGNAMFALYNRASAFVYPSRAEGWGLPLIEALAMGIPTMSTNYSGHTEFLRTVEGLFMQVRHSMVPIDDELFFGFWPGLRSLGARWAEPSEEDLLRHMREVFHDYTLAQENALKASQLIRERFSWQNSADLILKHIMKRGFLSVNYSRA